MKRIMLMLMGSIAVAQAQTSPEWSQNYAPGLGEVNSALAKKPDLTAQATINEAIFAKLDPTGGRSGLHVTSSTGLAPALAALLKDGVNIKSGGAKCDGVTDDTAAINAVMAANRVVLIPTGTRTCLVSGQVNVSLDNTTLFGYGIGSGTLMSTSASSPVIKVGAGLTQVTLHGFTVDRSVTPVAGASGIDYTSGGTNAEVSNILAQNQYFGFALGGIAYGQATGNQAVNNYSDGFHLINSDGFSSSQWLMTNNISQGNNGWGYNVVSAGKDAMVLLSWLNDTSFANNLGGAAFHGTVDAPIYDVTIVGGVYSSDNGPELYFDTYGGQHRVGGSAFLELAGQIATGRKLALAASHRGQGIYVTGTNQDVSVDNSFVSSNSQQGSICGAFRCKYTGNVFTQNGMASPNVYPGMDFENSQSGSTVQVVGNRSGNLNTSSPQALGASFLNGVDTVVADNDFSLNGTAALAVAATSTSMSAHNNLGFVVQSSAVDSVPVGKTSVVVTHRMSLAPTQVTIGPNTSNGTGMWADTFTSTNFTVHIPVAQASIVGFSWSAKVFNR